MFSFIIRFAIYRATIDETNQINESFLTGPKNIHLDMNPWWYFESSNDVLFGLNSILYNDSQDLIKENNLIIQSMGPHIQCVLNFENNLSEDGGTILIPGYHKHLDTWCETYQSLRKPLPWLSLNNKIENELIQLSKRIPLKEGCVLMWNQTMFHGTSPNKSTNCRFAQYLKAFSHTKNFPLDSNGINERLLRRKHLIEQLLNQNGLRENISTLGEKLFGLV